MPTIIALLSNIKVYDIFLIGILEYKKTLILPVFETL